MKKHASKRRMPTRKQLLALISSLLLVIMLNVGLSLADSSTTDFESFTLGSVNGQNGWSMTGPYDVAIVDPNDFDHSTLGNRSLRISNAVTSSSFGDHTFSFSLADEAGETDAENNGLSGGTRERFFQAEWIIASAVPTTTQTGLSVTVSPDRGDGARMSYIKIDDMLGGLAVNFYDYDINQGDPCADNFVFSNIATGLDRSVPHTFKVRMEFIDGSNNDVVQVYIDDVLVHTGTSWEDYFRDCEGPGGSRTVDSLLFRVSGTAVPATNGKGFLIDAVQLTASDCIVNPLDGIATTSTDGHTTPYCTIEEAMFASSGANQAVHVSEGDWSGEVMNRDYSDSPNLLVQATGSATNTVVNGLNLTGSVFDGLTFENFAITGDAPTSGGYDPHYAVEITNDGGYANLTFVDNIFDGQNIEDIGAIFSNRGWDGFTLNNNRFINYKESPLTPVGDYFANYSLVFMEAQVDTPAGRGNNFIATNNTFDDIRHLNALEAYRWQNVTLQDNIVTGTFGRLLIWSKDTDPLLNVDIIDNHITISAGTDTNKSTGIGVYYTDATVDISGNTVEGANTCLNTNGVTNLSVTDNTFTQCATRSHLFTDSDPDGPDIEPPYVAPVSAVIENNRFDNGPVGVENAAQTFELNACNNTFTDIVDKRLANPGPFATCAADLALTKTVTPINPLPGQTITYTLTYTNNGPDLASGVLITDVVPGAITNTLFVGSSGADVSVISGTTFVWMVTGDLSADAGGVISLTGTVDSSLVGGEVITNTAQISSADPTSEVTDATASITVQQPVTTDPEDTMIYMPIILRDHNNPED